MTLTYAQKFEVRAAMEGRAWSHRDQQDYFYDPIMPAWSPEEEAYATHLEERRPQPTVEWLREYRRRAQERRRTLMAPTYLRATRALADQIEFNVIRGSTDFTPAKPAPVF